MPIYKAFKVSTISERNKLLEYPNFPQTQRMFTLKPGAV